MRNSTYYNLKLVEGTDIVNPLTTEVPNMIKIDETMHENAIAGVTLATELTNGTVHALMRENTDCAVIRFIATSEWKAGDSVTVDGLPVTALLPSGETLPDGAYVINANVLCILTGTILTVYAERKNTENANAIVYNNTTVASELNKLNSNIDNLSNLLKVERYEVMFEFSNSMDSIINCTITAPEGYKLLCPVNTRIGITGFIIYNPGRVMSENVIQLGISTASGKAETRTIPGELACLFIKA